jgi:hypothetical protein
MITGELWKAVAIALLIALVGTVLGLGGKLWLTDRDLNKAKEELAVANTNVVNLRTSISIQNAAVDTLKADKDKADARADAAWRVAAGKSVQMDKILKNIQDIKATTCQEAMPVVNQVLEGLK